MQEQEVLAYVNAAARAVGLTLDAAQARSVAAHLARTAALAQALEAVPLAPADEPAEVYCPAPFPDEGGER
ncbi:MAG: DUF4089 domain-containing protein [Ramlibacter sp.]